MLCFDYDRLAFASRATAASQGASFVLSSYGRSPVGYNWSTAENRGGGVNFFELDCGEGWTGVGTVAVHSDKTAGNGDEHSLWPPLQDVACCVPARAVPALCGKLDLSMRREERLLVVEIAVLVKT